MEAAATLKLTRVMTDLAHNSQYCQCAGRGKDERPAYAREHCNVSLPFRMLLELVLVIVVYMSPVLCVGLRYCLVVGFMIGRHLVPALGRLGMLALFVSLL